RVRGALTPRVARHYVRTRTSVMPRTIRRSAAATMLALLLVTPLVSTVRAASALVAGWPVTGGDAGGGRFSPLTDIDKSNVARLTVAWTYRHGDYRSGWPIPDARGSAFEG